MSKTQFAIGIQAVELIINKNDKDIICIHMEHETANLRVKKISKLAEQKDIKIKFTNRSRLSQMSKNVRHQGVVAELRNKKLLSEADLRNMIEKRLMDTNNAPLLFLILDGIQDPHNLGACMRTSDAAGVDAIIVPRHSVAGLSPAVSKVASGAAENLPLAAVGNLNRIIKWFKEYGISIIGTSDRAKTSLLEAKLSGSLALVMGQESKGISKNILQRCDTIISLPMLGVVESLNVSVATGICLFEIVRQRALHEA
ncbi:MAG: 23S rRNA (guanosine(2251)-2'-O)-methyltransferase RlmB [Woeseia sp.]|nr:23S rRNA (guanosine(2251)-2'-O)-methyltransferase RlmB [Woeseia sp.]|tara:strand:- start:21128 stop:21895 length:768 start_codon:yes stop_codon:yes gene_type:complete